MTDYFGAPFFVFVRESSRSRAAQAMINSQAINLDLEDVSNRAGLGLLSEADLDRFLL